MGAPTPRLLALGRSLTPIHEAAYRFGAYLSELERRLHRSARESPTDDTKRELNDKLAALLAAFARAEVIHPHDELDRLKHDVRDILGPWLWRSELWNRAFHKPHGYAGDFGLFERLDALVQDGADALKPPIAACLDHAFAELDLARAIAERRALLASTLIRERARKREALSILDVTPRGARHLGDYLAELSDASDERVTIVDNDTSVLSFLERVVLARFGINARMIAAPFHRVRSTMLNERYDVILVSNQLDALDDEAAREDLAALGACLAKNGVLVGVSMHSDDASRGVREWLLDWPCYARDAIALRSLMPEGAEVGLSPDGLLAIATYRLS